MNPGEPSLCIERIPVLSRASPDSHGHLVMSDRDLLRVWPIRSYRTGSLSLATMMQHHI